MKAYATYILMMGAALLAASCGSGETTVYPVPDGDDSAESDADDVDEFAADGDPGDPGDPEPETEAEPDAADESDAPDGDTADEEGPAADGDEAEPEPETEAVCAVDAYRCKPGDATTIERCGAGGEWAFYRDCSLDGQVCADGGCVATGDGDIEQEAEAEAPATYIDPTTGLEWQNQNDWWQEGTMQEAGQYCETLQWAGHDDWHLPTIGQLRSLMRGCVPIGMGGACAVADYSVGACEFYGSCPAIEQCNKHAGPGQYGVYLPDDFLWWPIFGPPDPISASLCQREDGSYASWVISFETPTIYYPEDSSPTGSFICVRFPASPEQKTYADQASGLEWQNPGDWWYAATFAEAGPHCDGLQWAGHDDWRLPTIDELRTLVSGCAPIATGGACGIANHSVGPCYMYYDEADCQNHGQCGPGQGPGQNGGYLPTGMDWTAAFGDGPVLSATQCQLPDDSYTPWALTFGRPTINTLGFSPAGGWVLCVR